MKVVLFCGGLGTRLREYSETIPKPMVEIGYRPMIWHLMRYYAHYGHKEFILCLGYRGDIIKKYFLGYDECLSNNFVLTNGGRDIRLGNSDIEDWTISFVDTGLRSNIGQRLLAVRDYLGDDEVFMANYSDGLSDLDLNLYVDFFHRSAAMASFLCVKPTQSLHLVDLHTDGIVKDVRPMGESGLWVNGGFFILKRGIFDYLRPGEELVEEPFQRLIAENQLIAYRNTGFWGCIDTFKDKTRFDEMYATGDTPWMVWERTGDGKEKRSTPRRNEGTANGIDVVAGSYRVLRNAHL